MVRSGLRDPRVSISKLKDTKNVPNVWIWYRLKLEVDDQTPSGGVVWKFSEDDVCSDVALVMWQQFQIFVPKPHLMFLLKGTLI
uniref:Uncharacterized protein n=2 Tax=Araneus ventricosus TaxID=182803 RepID=A0A4Y1ZJN0_ARAVE|nr:hypothetical protein AVEN_239559-1 [Araneus ventricosus]